MYNFNTFLKEFKLSESIVRDFDNHSEENITAVQNILNFILLQNLCLIYKKLDSIAETDEGFYPQKEISAGKIIFEMWLKSSGIEQMIDQNSAYDTLIKAGLKVNLETDKIKEIHQAIQKKDD